MKSQKVLYHEFIYLKTWCQLNTYHTRKKIQQQQHSLLSQTSWGRLEMKPKIVLNTYHTRKKDKYYKFYLEVPIGAYMLILKRLDRRTKDRS
jgi:hypothetical protein